MAVEELPFPTFLDRVVIFPSGESFEMLRALTTFRGCHDGTPKEARIVSTCKRTHPEPSGDEFIMKIKAQVPAEGQQPVDGPSTTTAHELKALTTFRDAKATFAPQLVAFCQKTQDSRGPLPGGFLTYTVMTKLPGDALFGKFWGMTAQEREEIVPLATKALRSIYELGIEPIDRGMRNVVWEPQTKQCSIIDFELWNETEKTFADEKRELQRWGLIRTPAAKNHWDAWNSMYR